MRPTILLAALLSALPAAAPVSAAPPRPNIVFLLIDDVGSADCGFAGGTQIATPHIDGLAAGGTILDALYVQPSCSPTRACLLTGRYPTRTGVYTVVRPHAPWGLPLTERTLAEVLREAGYRTAIAGKWHLGEFEPAYLPMARGFDRQYGHSFGAIDYFTHARDGVHDWSRDGVEVREKGYSTNLIAKEACRMIADRDPHKPLFLYVPFNAVHSPLQAPAAAVAAYAAIEDRRRRSLAGMLSAVDAAIGTIVAALDRAGIRDDTLIVFCGDNGGCRPGSNGPLRDYKGSLYEGGIRTCGFVNWPGRVPAGRRVAAPIHTVDWLPTLAALAGGRLPDDPPLDGRDVWPAITAGAASPHDAVLVATGPDAAALRMGDWKIVADGRGRPELYDLATDPGERRDLAGERPDRLAALEARLAAALADAVPTAERPGPADTPADAPRRRRRERAADVSRPPSVLVILSDDQRADTIHSLGNEAIRTPALDALVARGTVFDRAYCMGGMVAGICVPSRAMLLSGRSLFRADRDLAGCDTWPERFEAAGYRTFVTGKWHNGAASLRRCFAAGEAVFLGGMHDQWTVPTVSFRDHGAPMPDGPSGLHSSERFGAAAERFVTGLGDEPFFCWVSFTAPHDPRQAPAEFRTRWNGREPAPPANFLPEHPFDNGELTVRDEQLLGRPRQPADVSQALADYYACVEAMDDRIARIIAALEVRGRLADTIVLFTSDHGLALGSHGLLGKQNLYEHSMRVPAILAGPGVPAARRVDALAYLFDLTATVGDLAGVPAPDRSEGRSLGPVLRDEQPDIRGSLLLAYRTVQRALVTPDWKLIDYPRARRVQLFDLVKDPAERHDRSADADEAALLADLREQLAAAQREAGDPLVATEADHDDNDSDMDNDNDDPAPRRPRRRGGSRRPAGDAPAEPAAARAKSG